MSQASSSAASSANQPVVALTATQQKNHNLAVQAKWAGSIILIIGALVAGAGVCAMFSDKVQAFKWLKSVKDYAGLPMGVGAFLVVLGSGVIVVGIRKESDSKKPDVEKRAQPAADLFAQPNAAQQPEKSAQQKAQDKERALQAKEERLIAKYKFEGESLVGIGVFLLIGAAVATFFGVPAVLAGNRTFSHNFQWLQTIVDPVKDNGIAILVGAAAIPALLGAGLIGRGIYDIKQSEGANEAAKARRTKLMIAGEYVPPEASLVAPAALAAVAAPDVDPISVLPQAPGVSAKPADAASQAPQQPAPITWQFNKDKDGDYIYTRTSYNEKGEEVFTQFTLLYDEEGTKWHYLCSIATDEPSIWHNPAEHGPLPA